MYVAQPTFTQAADQDSDGAAMVVHGYLANQRDRGRLCVGDWLIAVTDDGYQASVLLPEEDALGASAHEELASGGVALSGVACAPMLEADPICRCERPSCYVLYTHAFAHEPPVRCGDCWGYVPLYRLPGASDADLRGLVYWQSQWCMCDRIQLGCGMLERACLRQMGRLDSELSKQGLECCRQLSEMTGAPAYYTPHRCYGRSKKQERARKCPGCGGEWLLEEPWHRLFDFRCDRCWLASNVAYMLP